MLTESKRTELEKLGQRIENDYRFRQLFGPIIHVVRGLVIIIGVAAFLSLLLGRVNGITIYFIYFALLDQLILRISEGLEQWHSEKRIDIHHDIYLKIKEVVEKGGENDGK